MIHVSQNPHSGQCEIMTGVWIMSALSSSCTPRCVNWPTCCQWTGRWDRGWTLWPENLPKQLIKNCRWCFSLSLILLPDLYLLSCCIGLERRDGWLTVDLCRSLWTPWCLCAGSCVRFLVPQQSVSLLPSPPSQSACPSLVRPSAPLWWREQLRTSTELWSKKRGGWVLDVSQMNLLRIIEKSFWSQL